MARSSLNICPSNCDDILTSAKKFKPPPPPGDKDLWQLQFCRWWGWNWVQKTDVQQKMDCECCEITNDIHQKAQK